MQEREGIPKFVVEKYQDNIFFMIYIDQCPMEAVETRTSWIMPMGYEVEKKILELNAQHLLNNSMDAFEERFGTYAEKRLKLHSQFKKLKLVRKARKEVKAYVESIGITKEAIREARKRNRLLVEESIKDKKAKPEFFAPKTRQ